MDENIERYYQVLNLERTASPDEIYQAYRDLARVWDPQRFAHSPRLELKAEAKLKEIIAAYHALLPAGVPSGGSTAVDQAGPRPEWDPFAAPEPQRLVADLHRPVDLPQPIQPQRPKPVIATEEPAKARPPVLPQAQTAPAVAPQQPVPRVQPAPAPQVPPAVSQAAASAVPPAAKAPASAQAAAPVENAAAPPESKWRRARMVPLAVAGGAALVVLGAVFFIHQSRAVPPPSVQLPEPPRPVTPSIDPPLGRSVEPAPAEATAESDLEPAASASQRRRVRRGASVAEETPRQLPTGADLMTPAGRGGAGRFRIVNHSGQDSVIRVASQSEPEAPLRLVYVQADTEVTIGNIGTGVYYVTFSLGPMTSKPRRFGSRLGPFQFLQIQSTTGYESDQYQIVLKPQM